MQSSHASIRNDQPFNSSTAPLLPTVKKLQVRTIMAGVSTCTCTEAFHLVLAPIRRLILDDADALRDLIHGREYHAMDTRLWAASSIMGRVYSSRQEVQ